MAQFKPEFAHDVLIPIAEAAYLGNLRPDSLPPGYEPVGAIRISENRFAAMMAMANEAVLPTHLAMVQRMRQDGEAFGWVVQNTQEHILVVSFRGTVSLEDWLRDFDFLSTPYEPVPNYGTVHRGFHAVYQVVRESMLDGIRNAADQKFTRLIVTGHSLGAALSELAAPDLLHNGGFAVVPEVQNFAGPRMGHHDFASLFDVQIDTCFRVVNAWDIVPHLPPPLALFEHVGAAVRVNGGFTLDELTAHSLERSYAPGLAKLMPQAGAPLKTASMAAASFGDEMLVGREP